MDDAFSRRSRFSKSMHMRHNIMPPLLLLHPRNLKILIRQHQILPHLRQRFLSDRLNAELPLRLSEVKPQLSPCRVPGALGEELLNLR